MAGPKHEASSPPETRKLGPRLDTCPTIFYTTRLPSLPEPSPLLSGTSGECLCVNPPISHPPTCVLSFHVSRQILQKMVTSRQPQHQTNIHRGHTKKHRQQKSGAQPPEPTWRLPWPSSGTDPPGNARGVGSLPGLGTRILPARAAGGRGRRPKEQPAPQGGPVQPDPSTVHRRLEKNGEHPGDKSQPTQAHRLIAKWTRCVAAGKLLNPVSSGDNQLSQDSSRRIPRVPEFEAPWNDGWPITNLSSRQTPLAETLYSSSLYSQPSHNAGRSAGTQ